MMEFLCHICKMYTEQNLNELQQFFDTVKLPAQIQLTKDQKIIDVEKFVKGHMDCARSNIGKNAFLSFYNRLVGLKELLQGK
jgi:hypothetical protein